MKENETRSNSITSIPNYEEDIQSFTKQLVEIIGRNISNSSILNTELQLALKELPENELSRLFQAVLLKSSGAPDNIPEGFDIDYSLLHNTISSHVDESIVSFCNQISFANCKLRILDNIQCRTDGSLYGIAIDSGDIAVPSLLNSDIGCGVITTKIGDISLYENTWKGGSSFSNVVKSIVPMEGSLRGEAYYHQPNRVLQSLSCYNSLENVDKIERSFGTLGYADHCIILSTDEHTNSLYLTVHGGCDELAKQVYDVYQEMAEKENYVKGWSMIKNKILEESQDIASSSLLRKAFLNAINELESYSNQTRSLYLKGESVYQYYHDMQICNQYASDSRYTIMKLIMDAMGWLPDGEPIQYIDTPHTYYDPNDSITRCGAVPTHDGLPIVFDFSSDHYVLIGYGKGTRENLSSYPSKFTTINMNKMKLMEDEVIMGISDNITAHKILKPLLVYTPNKKRSE